MTKNQKIAAGCGGLGCLGLLVLAVAGGLGYYFYYLPRRSERVYNFNVNVNSNSNSNDSNRNSNENTNSSSTNSSRDSSSSYSDDEKHKLYQAASMSGDADLMQKVSKKLGLFTAEGIPKDDYPEFIKDHGTWAISNAAFIASLDTPDKARAYVDAHL
jgi:hypothetical protein